MRPSGFAAAGLLLLCACSQTTHAATLAQATPVPTSPVFAPQTPFVPNSPTAPPAQPAPPTQTAPPAQPAPTQRPGAATPRADSTTPVLTRAQLRQNVSDHLYTQPDATTLARAANGSLQGQRVQIRGVVRRVQLGDGNSHYAAGGWQARNWLSVDTAPGSAVDGQVSILYDGDVSVVHAGEPVTVFGRVQGYDPTSTNGFAAKPGPPLVVAEFVAGFGAP